VRQNILKITPLLVLLLVIFAGRSYVLNVLKDDSVEIVQKMDEKKVPNVAPANIMITVEGERISIKKSLRLSNTDTFIEAMESLREEGYISFERLAYIDGMRITAINNIESNDINEWRVFLSMKEGQSTSADPLLFDDYELNILKQAEGAEVDITQYIDTMNIIDEGDYRIVYIKISDM